MDGYSRLIALLKVLLPLTALAILSTLFLLSRSVDPVSTIPFSDGDISERLRDQQVTGPFFSGTTEAGDLLTLSARVARPGMIGTEKPAAEDMTLQIDLVAGRRIILKAATGALIDGGQRVAFGGNVDITTSDGMRFRTQNLVADLRDTAAEAPGAVFGEGPFGEFTAGSVSITRESADQSVHIVFTNRVKLVYEPQN